MFVDESAVVLLAVPAAGVVLALPLVVLVVVEAALGPDV